MVPQVQSLPPRFRAVLALTLLAIACAGCTTPDAPPGAPGSFTPYIHGQTAVSIGASGR